MPAAASQPLPINSAGAPHPAKNQQRNESEGDALAAIVATARAEISAREDNAADASTDVLTLVAEGGDGVMLLADVLAAGHSRALVAALLTQGSDKRIRARLAIGIVAGVEVVWLRTSGWQAVGQPNRRETPPTQSSLRHRLSAHNFERTMLAGVEPVGRERGVLLSVVRGAPLREYITQRTGDAWTIIKTAGSAELLNAASGVLGGVYPDALVAESWPASLVVDKDQTRAKTWPKTGDPAALSERQGPDWASAIEIELSGKAAPLVSAKVRQHDTAMLLGWWQAVVWITDDTDTLTRLVRAGVGGADHPGHYLLPGSAVGIGGSPTVPVGMPLPPVPWWHATLMGRRA
jgi:hypothetical protein